MNVLLIIGWAVYIAAALVVQQHLPGVDALAAGLLIALQSGNRRAALWLFIVFCLIQEGTGSLNFGSSVLWYGGQIAFYGVGSRFFAATNFFSVILFSCLFAVWLGTVQWLMSALQDYGRDYQQLVQTCLTQAAVTPVMWLCASWLRNRMRMAANAPH